MRGPTILVRPDPAGHALLISPLGDDPRFEALRALVDGDGPYVLRSEADPGTGGFVIYGRPGTRDHPQGPERPLARVGRAEAARFCADRRPALALEPL